MNLAVIEVRESGEIPLLKGFKWPTHQNKPIHVLGKGSAVEPGGIFLGDLAQYGDGRLINTAGDDTD